MVLKKMIDKSNEIELQFIDVPTNRKLHYEIMNGFHTINREIILLNSTLVVRLDKNEQKCKTTFKLFDDDMLIYTNTFVIQKRKDDEIGIWNLTVDTKLDCNNIDMEQQAISLIRR
ncbi:hypothetical protein DWY01_10465 [Eubacterium sp. AF22-8LB]|uniref:hypothetical protein n=1 Tax=Eubacterium sp. AF22-8LB TaxID=2292232 RepID=UPI000E492749|nr:hypothetical protein [Eubacterium sp. AF22-8LB]RGS29090.1 hypothetical protein DWY01_10465 [Eubacterium sp. AF22-8LB]